MIDGVARGLRAASCALALLATSAVAAPDAAGAWRDAFQSSPADYDVATAAPPPVTGTLRSRFAVAVAGSRIRIRVSNEDGAEALAIAAASVGKAAGAGFDAAPGTLKVLTFGGRRAIVAPPGAAVLSDPVDLPVAVGAALVASIRAPAGVRLQPSGGVTMAAADGDQTLADKLAGERRVAGRPPVSGASVLTRRPPRIIVALGDSITDGNRSRPDQPRGWPEALDRRLAARADGAPRAVVNAGIAGNRVLATSWGDAALVRFDRDVARIDGVSHVVILEGINDIGAGGNDRPLETADLIAGYRQLIARARARGIKAVMGTLTPFAGSFYFSPAREAQRQAVNRWIRTSGEPDAVIDFDAATRDPAAPGRLRPAYDCGDHLHPNAQGYRAMGDAIDLRLFD
ncbi:MAG TPA: SGNH/GDSL hydrolase family protein [Phenylobacterium sp.]|uniref:SGNH/GDSL hydrolase family protein n=1 Tax=Phenylobacterium sp. TaxID=1871053 RepID=UPI002B493375|nr:SGNH/GDSL hydrolase family protein [Phenylobacterium sp.]HKR88982.1 SGNH/GDSL hydrolase family protein [Phenylobacterium sp.]